MWELQSHMHEYIAPSIMAHAEAQPDPLGWLCERVVDLSCDEPDYEVEFPKLRAEYADAEGKPIYWGPLIERLTDAAVQFGSTTNGGHEFYLDGWTTVPWCDEKTKEMWYS